MQCRQWFTLLRVGFGLLVALVPPAHSEESMWFHPWDNPQSDAQTIDCHERDNTKHRLCRLQLPEDPSDYDREANSEVRATVLSPTGEGALILTGDWTLPGPAYFFDFQSNQLVFQMGGDASPTNGLFSDDGKHLFATSIMGHLSVFGLYTDKGVGTEPHEVGQFQIFWDGNSTTYPFVRPKSDHVVLFGHDGKVYLRDVTSGNLLKVMPHHPMRKVGDEPRRVRDRVVERFLFGPKGRYLVTQYSGMTYLWDLEDSRQAPVRYFDGIALEDIQFDVSGQPSMNGKLIISKQAQDNASGSLDEADDLEPKNGYAQLLLAEYLLHGHSSDCETDGFRFYSDGPRFGVRLEGCDLWLTAPEEAQDKYIQHLVFDPEEEALLYLSSDEKRRPLRFQMVTKTGHSAFYLQSSLYDIHKLRVPVIDKDLYVVSDFIGVRHSMLTLFDPASPEPLLSEYYFQTETHCTGIDDAGRLVFRGGKLLRSGDGLEEEDQYGLWEYAYPAKESFPDGKETDTVRKGMAFCNTDEE